MSASQNQQESGHLAATEQTWSFDALIETPVTNSTVLAGEESVHAAGNDEAAHTETEPGLRDGREALFSPTSEAAPVSSTPVTSIKFPSRESEQASRRGAQQIGVEPLPAPRATPPSRSPSATGTISIAGSARGWTAPFELNPAAEPFDGARAMLLAHVQGGYQQRDDLSPADEPAPVGWAPPAPPEHELIIRQMASAIRHLATAVHRLEHVDLRHQADRVNALGTELFAEAFDWVYINEIANAGQESPVQE